MQRFFFLRGQQINKSMRSILIIGVISIASVWGACSKSGVKLREGTVELMFKNCTEGKISGTRQILCFDQLISDSRCPANAMCVWQGTAVARFSLTRNGEKYSFVLSILAMPGTYNKDTTLFGYKIEFVNLTPYPGTTPQPVPAEQMKAELKITKL